MGTLVLRLAHDFPCREFHSNQRKRKSLRMQSDILIALATQKTKHSISLIVKPREITDKFFSACCKQIIKVEKSLGGFQCTSSDARPFVTSRIEK